MASTRTRLLIGVGVAAIGYGAARASRSGPVSTDELLRLPSGEDSIVETDDGAQLAVTAAGAGDAGTVVLAHGWTNARQVWAPLAHHLVSGGHRVIAYDQRGHGDSRVGSAAITAGRLGEDLRTVLEEFDVSDAVVVGHSMGGVTVMALLADRPDVIAERAKALVLVATGAAAMGPDPRGETIAMRAVGSKVLTKAMRSPYGSRLVRGAVGDSPKAEWLAAMASMFAATPEPVRADCLSALAAMDVRHGLNGCTVPVVVHAGTRDRLTPADMNRAIADGIPGAKLVVHEGSGHMLQWERTADLAATISELAAAS